jgi:ABC-type phosphate/phosphonate transport system substrate-binding protein
MRIVPLLLLTGFALGSVSPSLQAGEEAVARPVRVALVTSWFRDSSAALAKPALDAFGSLVRTQTGVEAEVIRGGDALQLGTELKSAGVQLGIFQGVEFAWARAKNPHLRPLLIIVNQQPTRHGVLLVRADQKAASFAELRGKRCCLPQQSRIHLELFLERGCEGRDPSTFFSAFHRSPTVEEALDDLVDGTHDAVVTDELTLNNYQRRKPARFARLKVVQRSETFPPSVVAYQPGGVQPEQLQRFREGLLKAHQTVLGRHLLMLWHMTSFEPVPGDLDQLLDNILKVYPAPRQEQARP